jgi:hypothetical protein
MPAMGSQAAEACALEPLWGATPQAHRRAVHVGCQCSAAMAAGRAPGLRQAKADSGRANGTCS